QASGIITSTGTTLPLVVSLLHLLLAVAGTWQLFEIGRPVEPFRLDVRFLAKWVSLVLAVGLFSGFIVMALPGVFGPSDSMSYQVPLVVGGVLQFLMFVIASTRKRALALEHLILVVILLLP